MATKFISIIATALFPFACLAQKTDNTPVKSFYLERFLGTWYEIARFDHSFERGVDFATARYTMNDNGTIKVVNSGIKDGKVKTSVGKAKKTATTGLLRVSFFGPFYSDYRVMMISENYEYALIGSKSDKYLWILSRTPQVPGEVMNAILIEARSRGYNTGKLIWVEH